ncbi:MAG: hypothetical protein R3Y28_04210 [Candidatus Gastranaerophilales bacterium]
MTFEHDIFTFRQIASYSKKLNKNFKELLEILRQDPDVELDDVISVLTRMYFANIVINDWIQKDHQGFKKACRKVGLKMSQAHTNKL